jgi:soluble lytic murein transglycosylase-like protein
MYQDYENQQDYIQEEWLPEDEDEQYEYLGEPYQEVTQYEQPAGLFHASGPDPRLVAVATIIACLLLGMGLYSISSEISLPQIAHAAAPIQRVETLDAAIAAPPEQQLPPANEECTVSPLFPAKVRKWCSFIMANAAKHTLSPDLLAAVIWLESGGNELAYSRSGAVGLMQVMPRDGLSASFMCINGPCFKDRPTSVELQDPAFNIAYGSRYLAGLLSRKGDLREALKSYGPMDAGYTYADKVLSIFQRYKQSP